MASFGNLPKGASHTDIYAQAGKIFEEQVRRDRQTDYTQSKAFNDAIWYIAKEAQRWGFINLEDMAFVQALRLAPDDPRIYKEEGITFCIINDHKKALMSFDQALRFNPNYTEACKE